MGRYFGTDGFRGEANVDLTVEHAFKVGRFLGWYYGKKQGKRARVVIGKDTRRSSYMLEDALSCGLTASGADVFLLHVTTTPSVSYVTRTEDFDCGVMISASHNPYYDNGIKLINDRGEKMDEGTIADIEAYLDGETGEVPYATRDALGQTCDYAAGRNRYVGYLISLATRSYRGMRIGLDSVSYTHLRHLLHGLDGAQRTHLHSGQRLRLSGGGPCAVRPGAAGGKNAGNCGRCGPQRHPAEIRLSYALIRKCRSHPAFSLLLGGLPQNGIKPQEN